MLQSYIPFLPKGAEPINQKVAIHRQDNQIEFYTASGPIYSCTQSDRYGIRLAQGILINQGLATKTELARVLGVTPKTVGLNADIYERHGAAGLLTNRSNRGPYKLDAEKCRNVQRILDSGGSVCAAARAVGVTEGTIRAVIKKGKIKRPTPGVDDGKPEAKLPTTSERSSEDSSCSAGIGVKRHLDRSLARQGELFEAPPVFSPSEGVRYTGVLLALPILANLGLMDAGKSVYGALQKGFFGLRSILLTLAFMGFLRIKTPEQLKEHSPGEMGILLGLDRVPEAKTLRRKLKDMGLRNKAGDFISFFSKRWVEQDRSAIGFTYIDGHVRPYHGRKHKLPKTHVARRRLCMPSTTDFWVNDANSEPLFFVTSEANDSLLSVINGEVIPELKKLAGEETRVTLIFDREGWSPDSFKKWAGQGVDVVTYRKGNYAPWPEEWFTEVESQVRDVPVKYLLAECGVMIRNNFWVKEVRRFCENGHQTAILTTRKNLDAEEVARRMFARWNQENFFRYMRAEFALDHLVTDDVTPADVERMVPNPEKKEIRKKRDQLKRKLRKLRDEYAGKALKNDQVKRPTMRGFNIANPGCKKKILDLETQIDQIEKELKPIPEKVPLKMLLSKHEIVRLETERKMLTDAIKMVCYRAETALLNLVTPHYKRCRDEGRAFLKAVFKLPGDIVPDEERGVLSVRFHTMANPRSNRALKELCSIINEQKFVYPGTNMKMEFVVPDATNEIT